MTAYSNTRQTTLNAPAEEDLELTILMPCLNEHRSIGDCVREAYEALRAAEVRGEVLVVDNASSDGSATLAAAAGARVVSEPRQGYGQACLRGFREARGKYILMGDADGSYDFSLLPEFLQRLRNGHEFVNGSRIKGRIAPGAMPFLHRYLGVPLLTWLLNRLSGARLSDAHCGMRAFTREAVRKMELHASGMELASEMILQAARIGLRTSELPISYHARRGVSKLRTVSDGWRHLRFMLLYSPTYLFVVPGAAALVVGLAMLLTLAWGRIHIWRLYFDIHFMIIGSLLTILGFYVAMLGIYARTYALSIGVLQKDPLILWGKRHLTLEKGIMAGGLTMSIGLGLLFWILITWISRGFGFQGMNYLRPALLGLTLVVTGVQVIFSSFFLSLLMMRLDKRASDAATEEADPAFPPH